MSNATNMPLGAKGDIISASAANTPEILGVGADGLVLGADSGQASGLNWVASAGSGELVQQVYAEQASVINCNASIPYDDTIPQSGEGTEVMTATITPTNASNYLHITFNFWGTASAGVSIRVALFQDATANALTGVVDDAPANKHACTSLIYRMVAGTTSATTFKIRAGPGSGSFYVNGTLAGARIFGGVSVATLTINEIAV